MKDRRVIAVVAGLGGCLLATFLCISFSVLGVGAMAWFSLQEPDGVDIEVVAPTEVELNQEFDFVVRVKNTGTEPQTVRRIDFTSAYLDGFEITRSTPIYSYRNSAELMGIGVEVFEFQELVLEEETLDIVFEARAVKAGYYSGDMEVCISSDVICEKMVARTTVTE